MPFEQITYALEMTGIHIGRECIDFVQNIFMLIFFNEPRTFDGNNAYDICQSPFVYVDTSIDVDRQRPVTQGLADKDHAKTSETWVCLKIWYLMVPLYPLVHWYPLVS